MPSGEACPRPKRPVPSGSGSPPSSVTLPRPEEASPCSRARLPAKGPRWTSESASATERDEFLRAAWRVMVAAEVDPERLVFVDEMGLHTSLAPLYGYAPKGE